MIKKVRVDYRLLHGQVAFSWTSKLSADCILLVTDTLQDDPVRVTSVKLAKPPGVKVVVKTIEESIKAIKSGITDKQREVIYTRRRHALYGERIEIDLNNIMYDFATTFVENQDRKSTRLNSSHRSLSRMPSSA